MLSSGSQVAGGGPADGGNGAARIRAAVGVLWPDAELTVRRTPTRRGRSWLVLPSLERPILLVPPSCRGASVVLQPNNTGRGQAAMRVLALLQRGGLLRLLPLPRLVVTGAGGPAAAETLLQQELGQVSDIVVRLGRRRFKRALVLLPFDSSGQLLAVVKVARGAAARRALRQEHDVLVQVNEHHVPRLRVPAPLAHVESGDLGYFAMSPLTSQEVSGPRPVPVAQMRALADLTTPSWRPLRDTRVVRRLRRLVTALDDPDQRGWVSAALDALLEQLGDVEVPQGAWHGDWVPWNMAREADDVLLWDWEHFDLEVLRGWDHVHYLAQDHRTRTGTTPGAEDAWLEEAHDALARDWELDETQASAVLRTYLLEVNLRYLHDRQEDPLGGTPARTGWARELVARLGAGERRVATWTPDARTA